MQSVGDASLVGNAGLCASYFSKTAEIRIFSIPKTAEIRIFGKIICLIHWLLVAFAYGQWFNLDACKVGDFAYQQHINKLTQFNQA